MRPLASDSILAPAELDRYVAETRQAADAQASAEAAVESARQTLRATRALLSAGSSRIGPSVPVRAPSPGSVLAVHHKSEGVVAAGQPLVEVGDASALEVAADVLSDDATRIEVGMRALVEVGGRTVEGHVTRVEPVATTEISALGVEEQRVLVIVELGDATADETTPRLGHGYRVLVRFVERENPDALRIPTSALFEQSDSTATFVVVDDRAEIRTVEVGHRAGLWAEVLGGLRSGDVVITHPSDDLNDGDRVATE
jgi:HlyD family secretion protein